MYIWVFQAASFPHHVWDKELKIINKVEIFYYSSFFAYIFLCIILRYYPELLEGRGIMEDDVEVNICGLIWCASGRGWRRWENEE